MIVNGKPAVLPDLSASFDYYFKSVENDLRVCLPGEILSYDIEKRTAQVIPGYNRVYNTGVIKPMPILPNVPVLTIQGGGIHIGMPIMPGDECLIVFSDIHIGAWLKAGGQQTPPNARRHDISDAIAIVGLNSFANPLQTALTATEGGIATAMAKVAIDAETGLIAIQNGPLPANSLRGILDTFLAAVADSAVIDAPVKTAATNAIAQLATVLK